MSKSVSYYKATNKIIELREDIKSSKIYEDKLYDYKDYSILSNIDVDKVKNVIYLEWIIKADYKEFKINEVIPLTYE
jgi:hypothetical protein